MQHRKSKISASEALGASTAQTAAVTPVWVVWWEDPERSWEAICLSVAESETEYETRQADHLIKHWGKLGKSDQQSLLEWLDAHLQAVLPSDADTFVNPAKEIIRRASAGESGPVVVRTW